MTGSAVRNMIYLEDSEDEVYLARRILKRQGLALTLHHYPTLDRLLAALATDLSPDPSSSMFILDLNLKLGSGIDALRTLNAIETTHGVLIGFCTGSEDPADRRDALAAGADFFIPKPLFPGGIKQLCESVDMLSWEPDAPDGCPVRRQDASGAG